MNKENILVKELESLCHDYQYLDELKKHIEQENFALTKIYMSIQESIFLQSQIQIFNTKIKHLLINLLQEEEYLLSTLSQRQKIHNRIITLDQPYKNILYFKYVCDKPFDEIALKMNCSTKRIYQLHKEAINIYCNKYK